MLRRVNGFTWTGVAVQFVAAMMFFAGVAKAFTLTEFEASIRQWNVIPAEIVPLVIVIIPLAEVVIGAMVLAEPRRFVSRLCLLLLLITFTVAIVVESTISGEVVCNCFGPVSDRLELNAQLLIVRNVVLISVVAGSIAVSQRRGSAWHREGENEEGTR